MLDIKHCNQTKILAFGKKIVNQLFQKRDDDEFGVLKKFESEKQKRIY